jgi:hypothetical protein
MTHQSLVSLFVDGSDVDYQLMLDLGLIRHARNGFVLTDKGAELVRR